MRKADPYYDHKVYHIASKMNDEGEVSALCYKKPKAINLQRGQSWTLVPETATCSRCRDLVSKDGR
jgi:hypothetical protein